MPAAKANPSWPYNGHSLKFVEDGEEWDACNELWCILHKAVCEYCGKEGGKARSAKGALQKFQRQFPLTPCEAAPAPTK